MKKNWVYLLISAASVLQAASLQPAMQDPSQSQLLSQPQTKINIQNRVVAKVNSKLITVMDVVKKMDLIFCREFPQYANSLEAKIQFYQTNWRAFLDDLIDSELIVADAAEKKLAVSEGDVREEMENLFGPNVVLNIDNFGMNFDEVKQMLLTDITVRRMTYAMVNARIIHKVQPKEMRKYYEQEIKNHPIEDKWTYRVLSVSGPDSEACKHIATTAYNLLNQKLASIEDVEVQLKSKDLLNVTTSFNLSEEFVRNTSQLSESHKSIISKMETGQYTEPLSQMNRITNQTVWRIFYLKDHIEGHAIPFSEAEEQIKYALTEKAIAAETQKYRSQLRKRYGIDENYLNEMVPNNFNPFSIN